MIRVRTKHTDQIGTPWADIDPQEFQADTPQEVERVTDCILCADAHIAGLNARRSADNLIPRVFEIRWNWEDSLQGHYIPGTKVDSRLLPEGEDIRQASVIGNNFQKGDL